MRKKNSIIKIYIVFLLLGSCCSNILMGQVDTVPKAPLPPPPPKVNINEFIGIKEKMPVYGACISLPENEQRGCQNTLIKTFIEEHLQYPEAAKVNNISGVNVVVFVIEKDGTVTDLKLARDIGYGTGAEALRLVNLLISNSPKWQPGTQRGRPVRVQFNLPVKFKLN